MQINFAEIIDRIPFFNLFLELIDFADLHLNFNTGENLHGAFMSEDFCVSGFFFMHDVLKSLLKLLQKFQRKDFERIKFDLVILE